VLGFFRRRRVGAATVASRGRERETTVTDDTELIGLDPFDLLDREAARLDRCLLALPKGGWARPSRCEEWSIRDVLAHLAASEAYHHACLDGDVKAWLAREASRGVTDIASMNAMGIAERADQPPSRLLAEWRQANSETRRRFREDGDTIDTSVGPYPRRWQAFHVAGELATHADDMFLVANPAEDAERRGWRARFSRFVLGEEKPDLVVTLGPDGRTRVEGRGVDLDVDENELVEGAAGRLGESSRLDAEERAVLSTMP
jgi:uncharacterized protein (TIGR03083 family)